VNANAGGSGVNDAGGSGVNSGAGGSAVNMDAGGSGVNMDAGGSGVNMDTGGSGVNMAGDDTGGDASTSKSDAPNLGTAAVDPSESYATPKIASDIEGGTTSDLNGGLSKSDLEETSVDRGVSNFDKEASDLGKEASVSATPFAATPFAATPAAASIAAATLAAAIELDGSTSDLGEGASNIEGGTLICLARSKSRSSDEKKVRKA